MSFATVALVLAVLLACVVGVWLVRRHGSRGPSLARAARVEPTVHHPDQAQPLRQYSPQNVGNDASARPWERSQSTFGDLDGTDATSTPSTQPGFDAESFLRLSRDNFIRLQDAWDRGDVPVLRGMMTGDMLQQIQAQLTAREAQPGAAVSKTTVDMLEAKLLAVEAQDGAHLASVEFSGLLREGAATGPSPFREVWSILRAPSESGWQVAGVQALQ